MQKSLAVVITVFLMALIAAACPISADSNQPSVSNLVACDATGQNIFVYFNTGAKILFRSADFGDTWQTASIGQGLNGAVLISLIVSPEYGSDHTVWANSSSRVYRSTNSGANFAALPALPVNDNITSLAAGPSGQVLVGTSTGNDHGAVFLFNGASLAEPGHRKQRCLRRGFFTPFLAAIT